MPYGHKSGSVRAYEYGVPQTAIHHGLMEGGDLAVTEMSRRNALWNRLVEIEAEYRKQKAAILEPYPRPIVNGKLGKRQLPQEALDVLRGLDRATTDLVNAACRESGCYPCNYTDVKLSWLTARSKADPPRFHTFRGEGKVQVFVCPPITPEQAFAGESTLLRMSRGSREGDVVVQMRIGSEGPGHRTPIWLTLPVRLHRPLPAGAVIRGCSATRERIGPIVRWKWLVTVEQPSADAWRTYDGPRSGAISLDLGWRRVPGGLRVAVWRDTFGASGEVLLPEDPRPRGQRYLSQMAQVDRVKSRRQVLMNETVAALRAWRDTHGELPEWLRDEMSHMHLWKRQAKLALLCRDWKGRRFKGDQIGFAILDAWIGRDHHLWEWGYNLLDQAIRWRREIYRVFAADKARRYEEVILEDLDLSELAQQTREQHNQARARLGLKPVPIQQWHLARRYRQWAGCYQLRLALVNACTREGVKVTKLPTACTTMICPRCGSLELWDQAAELRHTCEECTAEYDQDAGAASNLLAGPEWYLGDGVVAGS